MVEFENVMLKQMNPEEIFCGILKTNEHSISLKKFTQSNLLIQTIKRKECRIWIQYKHFIAIEITFQTAQDTNLFVQQIKPIYSVNELPCFIKRTSPTPWEAYDPISDFERMDIKNWRLSTLNNEYKFSKSYPSKLLVPKIISDNTIRHCAKFRSKERIPVLCYVHSNRCSITRASQPLVGITSNRSIQDEKLVEAIFNASLISTLSERGSGVHSSASELASIADVTGSNFSSGSNTEAGSCLTVDSAQSSTKHEGGAKKENTVQVHEKLVFKLGDVHLEDAINSTNFDKCEKDPNIIDTEVAPKKESNLESTNSSYLNADPFAESTAPQNLATSITKDDIPGAITLSPSKHDKGLEMVPIDSKIIIDLQTEKIEKNHLNLIIDARPLANAIAQTAMGAGTEIQENYKNCKLIFLGIENIHVVRDSFIKLFQGNFIGF